MTAALDEVRNQVQIVDDYQLLVYQRFFDPPEKSLSDCRPLPPRPRFHELPRPQERSAGGGVYCLQDGGLPATRLPAQYQHATYGKALQQAVGGSLLDGCQHDFALGLHDSGPVACWIMYRP